MSIGGKQYNKKNGKEPSQLEKRKIGVFCSTCNKLETNKQTKKKKTNASTNQEKKKTEKGVKQVKRVNENDGEKQQRESRYSV